MKGQGLNLSTIAFLVLLLASACTPVPTPAPTPTPVPPTPTPGPVDLVMAFQDSLNRGAIDDAAAMFHDDKVGIHIPGIMPGNIGISQLLGGRDTLEYWAAMGLTLDLSGCNLEDNEVNCQMLARDEACLKSVGLDPAHYPKARFKFLDGKINLLTADMDLEEAWQLDSAWGHLENWGRLHLPDAKEKLDSPASTGTTPRQRGELMSKLRKEWAAANK
jgi:hypothetical protein